MATHAAVPVADSLVVKAAQRQVAAWLWTGTAMIFGMVVVGGWTRLTRSGLSMTEWRPQGFAYPRTDEDWSIAFDKYKQSPEFKQNNSWMDVEDFKSIYFWEWSHRMLGRTIGVVFAVPFTYFVARGYMHKPMVARCAAMIAMGGSQGLIGWWMVKSGLSEDTLIDGHARVSPYRLATHLASAFTIYSFVMWTALSVTRTAPVQVISDAGLRQLLRVRNVALPLSALVAVTAFSGAFVAGNQAGFCYNDFPYMNGRWIAEDIWVEHMGLLNHFQNSATVQFQHRILAMSSVAGVAALFAAAATGPAGGMAVLPNAVRIGVYAMGGVTVAQFCLGVTTLWFVVPPELGAAHQAGALTLFTATLFLLHSIGRYKVPMAALRGNLKRAAGVPAAAPPLPRAQPTRAFTSATTPPGPSA